MAAEGSPHSVFDVNDVAARIHAGEHAAETLLVQYFQRTVRALVARNCRPGEARVDDLSQDILLGLIQRLRVGGIADPQAIPAYLQTMIQHACSALYRKQSLNAPLDEQALQAADSAPGPEERINIETVAVRVRALLELLPVARDRELLRQFYIQGRSQDEVCAALGIDAEHFRKVASRARTRLRELIHQSQEWLPR